MNLNDYQKFTKTTAIYPQDKADIYLALGLASEAGEVAGKIKKHIRDGYMNLDDFFSECSDVLWYLARICDEYEITLEQLADINYTKLSSRKDRGTLGGSGDHR